MAETGIWEWELAQRQPNNASRLVCLFFIFHAIFMKPCKTMNYCCEKPTKVWQWRGAASALRIAINAIRRMLHWVSSRYRKWRHFSTFYGITNLPSGTILKLLTVAVAGCVVTVGTANLVSWSPRPSLCEAHPYFTGLNMTALPTMVIIPVI